MTHRPINSLSYNVRSLVETSRRIDLQKTLFHNNIDIGFIQECHLKKNTKMSISGYNFVYDGSSIGVAVVIKDSIPYNKIFINNTGFSCSFIQIDIKSNNTRKRFLIGSIYISCNHSTTNLYAGLSKILDTASSFDGFILGGDLNAKNQVWGDLADNSNGKILQKWLMDHNLDVIRICDKKPSYPNGSSFLDHFLLSPHLINVTAPNFNISTLPTFSDHFPVKMELKFDSAELILQSPRLLTSYKNTNWPQFRRDLEIASLSMMPPENRNIQNEELDDLINEFNSNLNSIHSAHSEKIELKANKVPLSENVKKMFKTKYRWQKELKKIFHRTGNRLSAEYNILSKQIQLLKTIIKELVNLEQAKTFNEKLKKITPGPSAFKEIYQALGKKKSPFCQEICIDNNTITNDNEISELFKEYYSSIFSEEVPVMPIGGIEERVSTCIEPVPRNIYTFNEEFKSSENNDFYHFTNLYSIKGIIKKINNKKSCGIDGISNFLIKKFPDLTLSLMVIIFNNCLNNCYFPKIWKSAKILPIKKKDKCVSLEDFRPISLLSNFGKIFELVLKEKLENEFVVNPVSSFQFGFKRFHSTQHALLKFSSDVVENLRNKSCTVAISLDIEKAFDSAWHKGIFYKLVDLGIDPYLIKIFQSYFLNRQFSIQINDVSSDFGLVSSGVPQGGVLAPLLFNLFLHDFPHTTNNSKAILYSDDCLIYAHDDSPTLALNDAAVHLDTINVFYKTWGIKINAAKSEAICIRNASGKCARYVVPQSKTLSLALDGVNIPFKSSIKYLGVHFDKLFKFNNHGRTLLSKAKKISGMFSGVMNSSYLPQRTKLLLYKVAIRSALVYAFPIWFAISPIVAKELEIFERSILRKCIGKYYESFTKRYSNTYIYKNSSVVPFCRYALNLQRTFVDKLQFHDNALINEIFECEENINWNGVSYLSPIGILHECIDDDPDPYILPNFYMTANPGSHRG